MKKQMALLVLLALVGCHKKPDSPPPPSDTANLSGSWSGPFTYTYPVVGGPVTSVTVKANLAMTLVQDGLGVKGTYTTSVGDSGTVSGNIQNHTFTGFLSFVPAGLGVSMNLIGSEMSLILTTGASSGNGSLTRSTGSSSAGIAGFEY